MSSEPIPDARSTHRPREQSPGRRTDRPGARPTVERFQALQDVLGRKWHPAIVHRLLQDGPQGFSDLQSAITGISGKMLSESLEDLEAAGFLARTIVSERPFRVEYSLTPRGEALRPVLRSMLEWETDHGGE